MRNTKPGKPRIVGVAFDRAADSGFPSPVQGCISPHHPVAGSGDDGVRLTTTRLAGHKTVLTFRGTVDGVPLPAVGPATPTALPAGSPCAPDAPATPLQTPADRDRALRGEALAVLLIETVLPLALETVREGEISAENGSVTNLPTHPGGAGGRPNRCHLPE